MAVLLTRDPTRSAVAAPSAVVWINGRRANVVAMNSDGRISTCDISRGRLQEGSYLAESSERSVTASESSSLVRAPHRLALERKYVAMFRRPDRLVDVEPAGPVSSEELVDRLRTLAT